MQALISGRAGVAILVEDERLLSINLDHLAPPVARTPRDVRFLLGDVRDIVAVESEDLPKIRQRLAEERDSDDALQLTLFMLDAELSEGARDESAGALEELLAHEAILRFVEGILHAHPVPRSADLAGAQRSAKRANATTVERMLGTLAEATTAIEEVWRAWEALPPTLFRGEEERVRTRAAFVRAGLFRAMVSARKAGARLDELVWQTSELQAIQRYPAVAEAWTAALQTTPLPLVGRTEPDDIESESLGEAPVMRGREILELVRVRQEEIMSAMRERHIVRAHQRIEDLVTYQFSVGQPIHVAKSLCTLASEAQKLGLYDLQAELTDGATQAAPDDVWSWRQRGKALLNTGDLARALEAYDRALSLGGDAVAKSGRAEVLKALGRFDEALQAYDDVVREHPESAVAKCGRAEVLKSLGRFDDALKVYEAAVLEHPENVFAKCGRAEVLKSLGLFDDALKVYEAAVLEHPESVVAKNGRAEVLKSQGRFDDALKAYEAAVREHPESTVAKNGRACLLAALKKPQEALQALFEGRPITKAEWIGYHVRGMILLRTDRVDESIAIFEEGQQNNPFVLDRDYFRTALAVARLHKRQYAAAAEVLAQVKLSRFQPQADLLRVHAFGVQSRFDEATAAFRRLPPPASDLVRELVDELHRRFVDRAPPQHDDDWLIRHEIDSCLLAA